MIGNLHTIHATPRHRRFVAITLAVAILGIASTAIAAPRFIVSSEVHKGSVYSELTIQFRCKVHYVDHDPANKSDVLRISLDPTTICTGAPPTVALSKELLRPVTADDAWLDTIEYFGESPGSEHLILTFTDEVRFDVRPSNAADAITVRVFGPAAEAMSAPVATPVERREVSQRVQRETDAPPRYVVNLQSSARRPATADLPSIGLPADTSLLIAEASIDGQTWYRVQVGYFSSAEEASRALREFRGHFPTAWIGRADDDALTSEVPALAASPSVASSPQAAAPDQQPASPDKIAELMNEARRAMTAGDLSKAVQIYTKVLQQPPNPYQPAAQEYLALARERNGQIAHAKAEYERYLEVYPDEEGADRVRQRLSALLATRSPAAVAAQTGSSGSTPAARRQANPWTLRTFASQYYRRDVNQVNDQDEVVNQSSIYTDVSLDARRRGERFDIASRITAGYRSDLLNDTGRSASGNDFRLSYAYLDVADAQTSLRGRLGRQTRNTGGVLGRFDGLNMTYTLNEKLRFDAVAGEPVYSTSTDLKDSRFFYGLSGSFAPFSNALELGAFFLQQDIEGLTDRSAVGTEVRYFGESGSLWGIVSYDAEFSELGSTFLQGSWRLPGNLTVTGLIDVRRSPFLSLGNALVGQQLESFNDMTLLFTEEELRQFALDRSPQVTTLSTGLSKPLSPKLQFNFNASLSTIDATPESAGVAATEETEYSYYSADFVASSLFTEGDVGIFGFRYSQSDTTDVYSINLDSRFPIGRTWRINPRLRVDYREIRSDQSTQWTYTPALRIQFRPGRHWRLELEAGKQFSRRDMALSDQDRESNFIYVGYQYFH
jgi:tetratricopeptide (TPR) repeat protein